MSDALKRFNAERLNIRKDRKYLFTANPAMLNNKLDFFLWTCSFPGPNDPLYTNSYYQLNLKFTAKYPFVPPKVSFAFDVFHPNVYKGGQVCLDILTEAWKPSMNIMQILSAIQQLLATPNLNSPANGQAAAALRKDLEIYNTKVRENIEKFHSLDKYLYNLDKN